MKEENVRIAGKQIVCTCYGTNYIFDSINDAEMFFADAYYSCDERSSEAERYKKVLQLLNEIKGDFKWVQ